MTPPPESKRVVFSACTIITRRYLSHARILADSFKRHEPAGRFYLLIVDGLPPGVSAEVDVVLLSPDDLQLPYLTELFFKYDLVEFCTAIKPTLLAMLMKQHGEEHLCYIDPDIMLARPLDELAAALSRHSIVLTPHILRPLPMDDQHPNDQDILMAGAYNLGFIGLAKTTQTFDFLSWWEQRLREGCRIDPATGLMTDQKWIDLVPGLFSSCHILRDDTYNVAYWNINSRRILRCGKQFLVNARPLAFFHFSNFDAEDPLAFSRDHGRGHITPGTGLADLLQLYARLQIEKGCRTSIQWKYQRATFDNGVSISAAARELYLKLSPAARDKFGNPFETDTAQSFFNWATTPRADLSNLSPFLMQLYRQRIDLQGAFPDIAGQHRDDFLNWARTTGPTEMGYDPAMVQLAAAADAPPPDQELQYADMVQQIRQLIRQTLPVQAAVAIVSKGDPALLELDGRPAVHFPSSPDGAFTGHYPPDGAAAVEMLNAVIERGFGYIVFPHTALWWLEHYTELQRHLDQNGQVAVDVSGVARVFQLNLSAPPVEESAEDRIDQLLADRAKQVEQLLAENARLKRLTADYEMLLQHGVSHANGFKVSWLPATSPQPGRPLPPPMPKKLGAPEIRWLSHDATGRVVSIVLPAGLESSFLRGTLQSLWEQVSLDSVEVIALTSTTPNPADVDYLTSEGAAIIELSADDPRLMNIGAARNFASRCCRGEIVIFLADGVTPGDPRWLANLVKPLDQAPVVAAAYTGAADFESLAVRAAILKSVAFPEDGLSDARTWAAVLRDAGNQVVAAEEARTQRHQTATDLFTVLREGISDGLAVPAVDRFQQHSTAPLPKEDFLSASGSVNDRDDDLRQLGRRLGRYLLSASTTRLGHRPGH